MSILQQVQPGPCPLDPDTGLPLCPSPTEIDAITVKKVFSENLEIQEEEMEIPFEAPTLEVITADADHADCVSAEVNLINCFPVDENHVRIIYSLQMISRVPLDEGGYEYGSETEIFTKVLCLPCANREEFELECEFHPRCLHSKISDRDELGNVTEVTSYADICMVVRMVAQVKLLVPSYGFCRPPTCSIFSPPCPVAPPDQCN